MSETASTTSCDDNKNEKAIDDAFQALLSSQRDILAQLNFGNSSSELQFTEGPDNLPIVSPHASAEFHSSYSDYQEYPGPYNSDYREYPTSNYYEEYPTGEYREYPDEYYYRENLRDSHHSVGVGDDRFILDQITIGPGEARGPEFFDVDTENRMRRKRETEQELMEFVAQKKKKQRRDSISFSTTGSGSAFCNELLPGPSNLTDLDESSSSLLLDDLDFPSIHSHTEATVLALREETAPHDFSEEEASRKDEATEDSSKVESEEDSEEKAVSMDTSDESKEQSAVSLKEPDVSTTDEVAPTPKRSQLSMWKPRSRPRVGMDDSTSDMSTTQVDQKQMWKPRKKESTITTLNDSCVSLHIEDLESPPHVSTMDEVVATRTPKRLQHSMWKPRSRPQVATDDSTSDMPITQVDQKQMWKPRKKKTTTTTLEDSRVSLHIKDLESPSVRCVSRSSSSHSSQQKTLNGVDGGNGMDDGSDDRPDRSRANSSDSTSSSPPPTVKALSVALQQSIGSMKSIQEWDRKMGLKRSHSKTMRLSSNSRKRLLEFLKQEQEELLLLQNGAAPSATAVPSVATSMVEDTPNQETTADEKPAA